MSLPDETRTTAVRSPAPASIDETDAGDGTPALDGGRPAPVLERGSSIGRYVLLERLGRGGMGVVYAAYDPELDRRIALKVLHDTEDDAAGRRRSRRLLREAQAMAQLSHPNVITVHDVGTFEGRVFFAMELVEGRTLTAWQRQQPRAWPELVETFVAAGRGLAAAHEAGLVHRDFKPDNVLVGEDGRVRVTDFGIARPPRGGARSISTTSDDEASRTAAIVALDEDHDGKRKQATVTVDVDRKVSPSRSWPAAASSSQAMGRTPSASASGRVLDMTLTRPGALAGTPAYMSPEQFGEGALDARGDQFSFCVALWEALYGEAPFAGTTAAERAVAVMSGALREPPATTDVPAFVRAALTRGLAVEPGARHPDMAALLTALGQRPVRRQRWWLAAGGLVAAMGATAAAIALRTDPCVSAGRDEMASTWGDEARASVETMMLGSALPYAPDTWSRVQARLDAKAEAWEAGRVDACRAGRDGRITAAQLARRERCLERQRAQLGALVDVLAQADDGTVERASTMVAELPRADACADPETLFDVPIEPEDPELLALRERYLYIVALEDAGRAKDALPLAEALEPEAVAHGDSELLVDAMRVRASLLARFDPAAGETAMRRTYFEAVRRHRDAVAARMATALVFNIGYIQARNEDGLEWVEHASAAIDRIGGQPRMRLTLLQHTGDTHTRHGDLDAAKVQYDLAWAMVDELEAQGEPPEVVAKQRRAVATGSAMVKFELGQITAARADLQQALANTEELVGSKHPEVGRLHNELGNVAMREGKLDEARDHYQTALQVWAVSDGEHAPSRVPVLTNLGNVADMQGRFEEARAYYEQALAVAEKVFGPEHVDVAFVLVNLGILYEHAGDVEQAQRRYEQALALRERARGTEHPSVVNPVLGLSRLALVRGDGEAARTHAERALKVRRAGGGEDGPGVAEVLLTVGRAQVLQGEAAEGRKTFERLLEICVSHECDAEWTARAAVELWLVLPPEERPQHDALLERTRADLERVGTEGATTRERLREAEALRQGRAGDAPGSQPQAQ